MENQQKIVETYAPTSENLRALGNGIELSKATRRILDQAERRHNFKDCVVTVEKEKQKKHISKALSWPTVLDRVLIKRRKPENNNNNNDKEGAKAKAEDDSQPETNAEILEKELKIMDEENKDETQFSFRRDLLRFILGWKFELFLLVLLALDVILLIVELELQTRVVCHIAWDRSVSSVSVPSGSPFLASPTTINCSAAEDLELTCEDTRSFSLPQEYAVCPFTVAEELPHHIHTAETAINWVSRVILIFFGLEIIGLVACSGITIFWRHKLYLLDFFIVSVSIALDIISALLHLDRASELIVIARVWRFARIVHGVGVSVHDVDEHEMEDEEEYLDEKDEIVEEFFPGSSPKLNHAEKKNADDGKAEKEEEKRE